MYFGNVNHWLQTQYSTEMALNLRYKYSGLHPS